MKLPLNWLKEYVKFQQSPEELANLFTFSGSEVEKIIYPDKVLNSVIVGKVLLCEKHPNADKLTVVKVQISENPKKSISVVCGAPNVKKDQKVAVALLGVTLANGVTLEKTEIRGVVSRGMICAEDELGIGDDHTNVIVLDNGARIGQKVKSALAVSRAVFDFEITPNRPDCFSIVGLAREAAALTKKQLILPKVKNLPLIKEGKEIGVLVKDRRACSQYIACHLADITVSKSPVWLETRLRESGIKPINNIVDITNYVMLACGQPLHAFDANIIKNHKRAVITVRKGERGEKITLLDDKEYALGSKNIVIADTKNPIAVAGVMGGVSSAVSSNTKEIILEAAIFHPVITRKSAQSLGIRTDSSTRFEKGINANAIKQAVEMAVGLYQELVGARLVGYKETPVFRQKKLKSVQLSYQEIGEAIGLKISKKKIHEHLTLLGFEVKPVGIGKIRVTVPDWRLDINIPADIIEEVARMHGVNKLPATNMRVDVTVPPQEPMRALSSAIRNIMISYGFYELYSYSFYSDKDRRGDFLSMFCDGRFNHLEVDNPLSSEQRFLRKSILPFIMRSLSKNIALDPDSGIMVFELGRIFIPRGNKLPKEDIITAGGMSFAKDILQNNLLYLKGVVENIFKKFGIKDELTARSVNERDVILEYNNEVIATIYILRSVERDMYKIKKPVGIFEISLTRLLKIESGKKAFHTIPSYPAVTRDLSFEFANDILWGSIEKAISSPLLESINFLNQYQMPNKKSIAFRLIFRAEDRTLTAEEVEQDINKIKQLLKTKFNAKIRRKK